jgi:hypothetical protein
MKGSRFLTALLLLFVANMAIGATGGGPYRIDLVDGRQVLSRDVPVTRGSVVTYHPQPSGRLTGLPLEMIVRVVAGVSSAGSSPASIVQPGQRLPATTGQKPLLPGDAVLVGETGAGSLTSQTPMTGAAVAPSANGGVPSGAAAVYGGGPAVNPNATNPALVINPDGTAVGTDGLRRVMSTSDLTAIAPGQTPVIGSNGFPATAPTGTQPVIGPNGTPVAVPSGQPASTTQPVIGPNGTPVMAPQGQPGSTPPTIGPNGTPVLAPPGQPGATAPVAAPNGTPGSPQPGGSAAGSASPNPR